MRRLPALLCVQLFKAGVVQHLDLLQPEGADVLNGLSPVTGENGVT
jgi:hypothetical protein